MKIRFFDIIVFLVFGNSLLNAQNSKDSILSKNLDQVVVTAQFLPTDTRQTVNSVKTITRKTIEMRSAVNLQELLQTEPNLRISADPILGSALSINGLKGENLKILIDGVPVVGRLNGSIDAGQIPLSNIQKVEIIQGAQSLLYGSEAAGGVINLITKKSQLSKVESEINTQFENNGFNTISGRIGYSTAKIISQLSGNFQDFSPKIDTLIGRDQIWNPKKQYSGRAFIRFMPSENMDIRLSTNILHETVDNLGEKKRPTYKPYSFDDYYTTDKHDVNLHLQKWTKSKNLLQITVGYNAFERVKNSYRFDFNENAKTLLAELQDTSSTQGNLTRITFSSDKTDRKWAYILGAENYYELAKGNRLTDTTSAVLHQARTNDLGIFASGKWKHKEITLQTGARYTHNLRYGSALTPSTWLLWQPKIPIQLRTSWAFGFRSPSVKELFFNFVDINHYVSGNSQLQPEKSINLLSEIKTNALKLGRTELSFTLGGFYNIVRERIILTALGPVHYEYRNLDYWKTKGGNFRLNLNINEWIRYQSDIITTGFFDPANVVNDSISPYLWSTDWANDLNISFFKGRLNWNIWHKFTGKSPYFYNQDGVTLQSKTNSYHMLNTSFSTHFFKQTLRLNIGVKNIMNIKQLQANNSNGIHIEASNQQNLHWGRNFFVSVNYVLGR